jgi:hypothetical protein
MRFDVECADRHLHQPADTLARLVQLAEAHRRDRQDDGQRRLFSGIDTKDYLLRRINGEQEPIILEANKAREALLDVTAAADRISALGRLRDPGRRGVCTNWLAPRVGSRR